MKIVFIILVVFHALIHFMGVAKAFGFADIPQIKQAVSTSEGVLWILAAILLLTSAISFPFNAKLFWMIGAPAMLLSQVLIIVHWHDAKYGSIANVIMLLPLVIAFAETRPSSYFKLYKREVHTRLNKLHGSSLLTDADIAHLPAPVQQYIRYTGSVDKPKVLNFRITFEGGIRRKPTDDFMQMHIEQCSFYGEPLRVFYIRSKMWGIPYDGLHLYKNGAATMQVKIASLFKIVDGKGDKMTQSETVTLFNDMCVFAPATLIDSNIQWQQIDALTANAKFTHAGHTIGATLYFNQVGELVDFSTDDRYLSEDGKTYTQYRWTTPMSDYKNFRGRKVASYAEATWHTPGGKFVYGKFRITDIEYNITHLAD